MGRVKRGGRSQSVTTASVETLESRRLVPEPRCEGEELGGKIFQGVPHLSDF